MTGNDQPTLTQTSLTGAIEYLKVAPALTIVWHPDVSRVGGMCSLSDSAQGESLLLSRLAPKFVRYTSTSALDDPFLSRKPCLSLIRTTTGIKLTPLASDTPVDFDGKPLRTEISLAMSDFECGRILTLGKRNVLCLHTAIQGNASHAGSDLGLLGHSDAMEVVRRAIQAIADLDLPVLVRGETGTGKELTVAAIVKNSRRADKPLVAINIAAMGANTTMAELFGHEKGSFTGATVNRKGYFGEADGGTLFLDEIGLASPEVQTALLRAIETKEVWPLGARSARRVEVRVIAATDVDLEQRVEAGTFSQPLLQRLGSAHIRLPALRDRRQDIGVLFLHFLRKILSETGELAKLETPITTKHPWLLADVVTKAALAPWPGNVRQLRNFASQLAVANRGADAVRLDPILLSFLGPGEEKAQSPNATSAPDQASVQPQLSSPVVISHEQLLDSLARNDFEPARAARDLGISRTTIYELIRKDPKLRKAADIPDSELQHLLHECQGDVAKLAQRMQVSVRAMQLRLSKL
jgi:two-component system nitrogen regulation response regulator GlnG